MSIFISQNYGVPIEATMHQRMWSDCTIPKKKGAINSVLVQPTKKAGHTSATSPKVNVETYCTVFYQSISGLAWCVVS